MKKIKSILSESLYTQHTLWVFIIILILCLMFTAITPKGTFLSYENFKNLLADGSELVILTMGATYLLIAAQMDLSVGANLVLDSVLTVKLMTWLVNRDVDIVLTIILAAIFATLFGAFVGLINGLLTTFMKIPSFIATLGMMGAAQGFARIISKGTNVTGVPKELMYFINSNFLSLPCSVWIALLTVIFCWVLLQYTKFGLHTFSVGSNAEATRRAGISVNWATIRVYMIMGFLVGIVTMIDLGRFGVASIAAHTTDNLNAISGAVIGGTSLFGGRGSIIGSSLGALIPAILRNGFIIVGFQAFWQEIAVAVVMILAVWFDQWRRNKMVRLAAAKHAKDETEE